MRVVCTYCEAEGRPSLIGELAPLDDSRISHGICAAHQTEITEKHRRFTRFPVDLRVTCHAPLRAGEDLQGAIREIGRGGLKVELPVSLLPGSTIHLTIDTPEGSLAEIAQTVWVRPAGESIQHGFSFLQPKHCGFAREIYRKSPRARGERVRMVQDSSRGETPRKGAVLIIDDEHICREAVSMMLGLAGYLPLAASNGREAVGLLNASLGEVVAALLDLHLPAENATALYDALARIHPELPLFLMSGEPEVSAMRRLGRAGTAGFLYKPSGVPAWIEKLDAALEDGRGPGLNDSPTVPPYGEH